MCGTCLRPSPSPGSVQDEGEGGGGLAGSIQMEEDGRVGENEREREDYKTRYF